MPKRKSQKNPQPATKKQKHNADMKATTPGDDLSPFEKLPLHIIEKIINMLDPSDIKKGMMLVNKNINGIISSSAKLMGNFFLNIKLEDFVRDRYNGFFGIRKYQCIVIEGNALKRRDLKAFKSWLEPYAIDIRDIRFRFGFDLLNCVDKQTVEEVLKRCNRVQTLDLSIPIDESQWVNLLPLELPDLKHLTFPGIGLIALFKSCQLKSFALSFLWSDFSNLEKEFLQTQLELEHLKLESLHKLFDDDSFTKMKFKLKSLVLCNDYDSRFEPNESFKSFINAQKDSLLKLTLNDSLMLKHFSHFQHIKKLTIHFSNFDGNNRNHRFDFVMESVEEISFSNIDIEQLAKNFPNLKVIELNRCHIRGDILKDLPYAKKLRFYQVYGREPLSLMNVKDVNLFKANVKYKAFDKNQLKEIIIDNLYCYYVEETCDWLMELLDNENTNIRYMRICSGITDDSPEFAAAIENNKHKIQCLVMN